MRWLGLLVWLAIGCAEPPITEVCPSRTFRRTISVDVALRIDLLFVIDRSPSMLDEQAALRAEIPRLIRMLATGDVDGDGVAEARPVHSLHVGVVPAEIRDADGRCISAADEAVLRGPEHASSCPVAIFERVFRFGYGGADPATTVRAFGCAGDLGVTGCTVEQPLEAALRALSPETQQPWIDPTLYGSYAPPYTGGLDDLRGDAENAGFLRRGSLLAVVVVTDEDDASASVRAAPITLADDPRDELPPAHELERLERYVDGLTQLHRSLLFVPIAAVPPDLLAEPYDTMLSDPRLTAAPGVASCRGSTGHGSAPRRLLELADRLDERGVATRVVSSCELQAEDLYAAFPRYALPAPTASACTPELPTDCAITVLLPGTSERPEDTQCAALGLPLLDVVAEDGAVRERCEVPEIAAGSAGPGWYPDSGDAARVPCPASATRVVIAGMGELVTGEVTVECALPLPPGGPGVPDGC